MIYCVKNRFAGPPGELYNPYRNLALEQVVFDKLDRGHNYFMLWQNHNSIIVGRYQNTQAEINSSLVKEKNITVARRLSGGGAVYHDLGNINFTFITDADKKTGLDFSVFCEPIRDALSSFGVPVEISGRNDMTVFGKKFSGNAQYVKEGRVMHHGTILYDSDLSVLSLALNAGNDKIESKGIKSVRSRVTNIKPYMKAGLAVTEFIDALEKHICSALDMKEFVLNDGHNAAADELKEKVYSQWSWNYGNSPPYTLRKARRVDGCGKIEIFLDLEREGKIKNIAFYGDFFGRKDPAELLGILAGRRLEYAGLEAALKNIEIDQYFYSLNKETFISLLLE